MRVLCKPKSSTGADAPRSECPVGPTCVLAIAENAAKEYSAKNPGQLPVFFIFVYMKPTKIVFATANHNKVIEIAGKLGEGYQIVTPAELGWEDDIPETHETIPENAVEKAQFVWDKFHKTCFADDTGLEVDFLNGAPGVYSARYAGLPKNPAQNVVKLLKELQGVPFEERTARFRCVIALIEDGELHTFEGICEGNISLEPMGELGFGYDPVFIPKGMEKTMAMLTLEEKNAISHRGHAVEKLIAHLTSWRETV